MKPKINLKDPRVKFAMNLFSTQMRKALEVKQTVESAVLPVLFPLKRKTKPEQIGSCVIVYIDGEYFAFSASHVFDVIGSHALLVGAGGMEKLTPLSGERFSTKRGPSGTHADDPLDASVFHIQGGLTDKIKKIAITVDDLDVSESSPSYSIYMAAGFRVKVSNTDGNKANGKRECFPSTEYGQDVYSSLSLNKDTHLGLAWEDQVFNGVGWQTSPSPKGISGGAIMKVEGINAMTSHNESQKPKQLLSAITIEQKREKNGKPGVLIGTRISLHLSLIKHFLPKLEINI